MTKLKYEIYEEEKEPELELDARKVQRKKFSFTCTFGNICKAPKIHMQYAYTVHTWNENLF